jgi:LysM repeat protein
MRATLVLTAIAGLFVSGLSGQDAFPLKPGELPDPVAPLKDPTGKDPKADPSAPVVKAKSAPPVSAVSKPTAPRTLIQPRDEDTVPSHIIESGDSLTKVAAKAYGRSGYWRLLKLYNECDPAKLKIGQVIKTPDLEWLLEEEHIVPLLKDAADSMMKGRSIFMDAEQAMDEKGIKVPDEEIKVLITEARKHVAHARELFSTKREGVIGLPNSTLLQLRT